MSTNSKIEWTTHTFNPWIGCEKVSPGCANCYAETQNAFRNWNPAGWGKGKPRKRTSDSNWNEPLLWNRKAAKAIVEALNNGEPKPERPRVFCSSLADWLDSAVPIEWLADLLATIQATPHLDWLLLSKRPQNWQPRINAIAYMLTERGDDEVAKGVPALAIDWKQGNAPDNVWIGTSVEDQIRADERIPELLKIPARIHFLSLEPLLGPVKLKPEWMELELQSFGNGVHFFPSIRWAIIGGESGEKARPMNPAWATDLQAQCWAAGIPYFFKQFGQWAPAWALDHDPQLQAMCAMGKVERKDFFDPQTGQPTAVFSVGKHRAGATLNGKIIREFPTLRV